MPYTFLDLAYDVLLTAGRPLTYQEIWQEAVDRDLAGRIRTSGKTPWQTLGSRLYVDVRDNPETRLMKVGSRPTRFFLLDRRDELPADAITRIEKEETRKPDTRTRYKERDLHPLLTYFLYATPSFNRGRSIYSKTILHQKSNRSGYNEWLHPDMVGFYLPIEDW